MALDAAFDGVGRDPGIIIWRIENFKVVPMAKISYGKFYTGDSYIILHTHRTKSGIKWNIHYWLGHETSKDESGVAAYKTVELDESLGGAPVQFREIQNHESKQFLSLFPSGLQYLAGGVGSGFRIVKRDIYEVRLLHVKGRRNIRVQQTKLAWSSMNHGDVFILDDGLSIYVWIGSKAGRLERVKGLDAARMIRDEERGGKANILIVEDEDSVSEAMKKFSKKMSNCAEGTSMDIQVPTDDATFEKNSQDFVKLYSVSDASGILKMEEVGNYPLKYELLDSNDAFILDTGSGIFAWLGSGATKQEKNTALKMAPKFIECKGYPSWTNVTILREGAETPLFKQNFINWYQKDAATYSLEVQSDTKSTKDSVHEVDVSSMLQQKQLTNTDSFGDDGSGKVDIWRIEDFEMKAVEESLHGQFNRGDSYIILYTYLHNNREKRIIYFWLGQESSQDEKASAALLVIQLDDQFGGEALQIRVVENKEPYHFLLIFRGKMVVHSGGKASGFKNRADKDSYDIDGTRLFHVRGTDAVNCRAVQVEELANSLNSNDCFILETPYNTYIWYGKGCSDDERQLANQIIKAAGLVKEREAIPIDESNEPEEFWTALGGKTEYASSKWLAEVLPSHPARLFQCSNATGRFIVDEIFNFVQQDLIEEDVMILDTYSEVFVWIGHGANEMERKESLKIAMKYIQNDPSGRNPDSTLLLQVKEGFEPNAFRCHFLGWNFNMWAQKKSYEDYKKSICDNEGITDVKEELKNYDDTRKFTYEKLRANPPGIDVSKKEQYLDDKEFYQIFSMSHDEFKAMPKWKQINLKKKVCLF